MLLSENEQRALVSELAAVVRRYTPDWTGFDQSDPGQTLLQLFAWLAETLLYRAGTIPERRRRVLAQLLEEFRKS